MVTTQTRPKKKPLIVQFWDSAVGKKWVMAVSGIVWLGFVFGHMLGNLHFFEDGGHGLDEYGESLRALFTPILPEHVFLWILRVGLIGAFALHVWAAYSLTVMNRNARIDKYQSPREYTIATYASRTMRWSGVFILIYLAWHLADLTWGLDVVNSEHVVGEVYNNLTYSLGRWPVNILYIVAQIALAAHLYHGVWSLFQSLGITSPRFNAIRRPLAAGFAVVTTGGYLVVPLTILFTDILG